MAHNKRNIIIGILVVAIVAALVFRFVFKPRADKEAGLALPREVSVITSWEVPNGVDRVRFTLGLDAEGRVISVKSTDVLKGDTVDENLQKFSDGLLLVIRGKKLSELEPVDRIGTSSLTTAAFNLVLPELKSQI